MSYTINLTDGNVFATISDGTINTTSSMTLVGKNYAGYGQFVDTNFMHLLENSSNVTQPPSPITGQLWWDSGNNLLKAYNGTGFKVISGATASSSAPAGSSSVAGDLWYNSVNSQLNVYTGSTWLLVGPQFTSGQGVTGAIATTINDNVGSPHDIIELVVHDEIVGIVSKDASFTPALTISGFTTVRPGITLATTVGGQAPLFQGVATNSQLLNSLASGDFMRATANTSTTGSLAILNNTGLTVGAGSNFRATVSGNDVTLRNQTNGGNLSIGVNVGGNTTSTFNMFGANGAIATTALSLSSALQFANLSTSQVNSISSPQIGMTVFNGETGNVQVYNGTKWANITLS